MNKFLCETCIYGQVKTKVGYKPLWASSMRSIPVESLTISCNKTLKQINWLIHKCDNYQNRQLTDFLK